MSIILFRLIIIICSSNFDHVSEFLYMKIDYLSLFGIHDWLCLCGSEEKNVFVDIIFFLAFVKLYLFHCTCSIGSIYYSNVSLFKLSRVMLKTPFLIL